MTDQQMQEWNHMCNIPQEMDSSLELKDQQEMDFPQEMIGPNQMNFSQEMKEPQEMMTRIKLLSILSLRQMRLNSNIADYLKMVRQKSKRNARK